MAPMKWYKVVAADGSSVNGGSGRWALPTADGPGAWMPPVASPVACERGYHLTDAAHLLGWLRTGAAVYEAEGRGAADNQSDKTAFAEARLLRLVGVASEKVLRLYAADCAEHVLPLFEKRYPNDARPREAIAAARAFARGEISREEMQVAAFAASAASAAADAAYAAAAASAAAAAAYAAAAAAADAAAERKWQTTHLLQCLRGGPNP